MALTDDRRALRILFVIQNLFVGGAERQLVAVARGLRRRGHHVSVAVFRGGGPFEEELRDDGIVLHDLRKGGRWDVASFGARLLRVVWSERPELLHAYMVPANIVCGVLKPLLPRVKVVWGIRSGYVELSRHDWLGPVARDLEVRTSVLADAIIANSLAAREAAIGAGMAPGRLIVIPNGIDCEAFRPDPIARQQLRGEWGIRRDERVVGMVSRLDPVKNHAMLLQAAERVVGARQDVRFVCVGGGAPEYARHLHDLARRAGLANQVLWVGERVATRAVYSAFDVAVLSSDRGESFPNVVGEAMACGTPCVATDTGDAATIVGPTGAVVPSRDVGALAAALLDLISRSVAARGDLSAAARARIQQHYSVARLVDRTEAALRAVRTGPGGLETMQTAWGRCAGRPPSR